MSRSVPGVKWWCPSTELFTHETGHSQDIDNFVMFSAQLECALQVVSMELHGALSQDCAHCHA